MVNDVRLMISEEDLASGPGTILDHSRAFVSTFIKERKGTEKASDIDIRRGTESAHSFSSFMCNVRLFTWYLSGFLR